MNDGQRHTNPSYDLAKLQSDYPLWKGQPERTILLCAHPRSGTTLLGEAMYFGGSLGCPLEYLHVGFRPAFAERWQCKDITSLVAAVKRHRTAPNGTLSIKLFWRDVCELAQEADPSKFAETLNELPNASPPETYDALAQLLNSLFPNITIVHLQRLDRVRQAVSSCIATDSGVWRSPPYGIQHLRTAPAYDFERIDRLIGYADYCHGHWNNLFRALKQEPLKLTYEELDADYQATVNRLFRHLGCEALPPATRLRRQADGRAEKMIVRFLREKAALRSSPDSVSLLK